MFKWIFCLFSFYNRYGFPGVVGCVDGSHFRIFHPKKSEEHLYYCRKHYHSLNVQMVCLNLSYSCLVCVPTCRNYVFHGNEMKYLVDPGCSRLYCCYKILLTYTYITFHYIHIQVNLILLCPHCIYFKVADDKCRIMAVNAKFGGATHDAFIWENSCINSYMQTLHESGESVWLLGKKNQSLSNFVYCYTFIGTATHLHYIRNNNIIQLYYSTITLT